MDFQTIRIYGSLFVILGCFIFLYPKLVHPLFLTLLGMNEKPEPRNEMNDLPPPLRGKHPDLAPGKANDVPDHIKRMRQHGPHPGMRAAAAEQKQTKGSGRGMMGVILPMYAVGIVVYLVYTLFKVFGKSDNNKEPKSAKASPIRETPYGTSFKDDPDEMDMRKLQERLAETEAQMTKILAAMQSVQTKVGDVGEQVKTATSVGSVAGNKENDKSSETEEKKDALNTSDRSSESSPESDSYEIVNKSDRDDNGEDILPQKVETLTSNSSQEVEKEGDDEEEDDNAEPREEIIKDKEPEDEEITTVRKRVTKKDEDS
ncbi:hypothetical protein ACF0H5_015829 [Mactra antiquata]